MCIRDSYIYDFVFDDGHIKNIYLADKQNIARNKVQVINQFEQVGTQTNRYDVTILVNGLPLVHVCLLYTSEKNRQNQTTIRLK